MKQVKNAKCRRAGTTAWSGVSQAARLAGVSKQHVSEVLRGNRRGSAAVWDAIESAGCRKGRKVARRPKARGVR